MVTGDLFGTRDLFAFIIAAIALNLVPGQDTLYILGRSLSQGRRAGIVSVLGIGTGCLVHITAAALGLYTVLALCPPVFFVITLLGGLYLIWVGIRMLVHRKAAGQRAGSDPASPAGAVPHAADPAADPSPDLRAIYRQGLTTNLLNPKVALFFLAFLPSFITPGSGYGAVSFLFLGIVFLATGTIWCMIVALGASLFADALRNNPKIQRGFDFFAGTLFVALGAGILFLHG